MKDHRHAIFDSIVLTGDEAQVYELFDLIDRRIFPVAYDDATQPADVFEEMGQDGVMRCVLRFERTTAKVLSQLFNLVESHIGPLDSAFLRSFGLTRNDLSQDSPTLAPRMESSERKSRAVQILDLVGWLLPPRLREPLLGDLLEESQKMRQQGIRHQLISTWVIWQLFVACLSHLPKWFWGALIAWFAVRMK